MPKPPKVLNASDGLLTFALMADAGEWIHNPKEWIAKSRLHQLSQEIALENANGDLISDIAIAPNAGRPKIEKKKKIQSISGKMKSNMNLEKRNWAIAFYLHQKAKGKITKAEAAQRIRALLVKHFPEDLPKGNAMAGASIPNAKTIETEWLGEKLS